MTRVDGKIVSVSDDYRKFAGIAGYLAGKPADDYSEISTTKIDSECLSDLSKMTKWDDLSPIGSAFQVNVWKRLYLLTHRSADDPRTPEEGVRLLSYSQLAEICGNPSGVRAVAHAVASNPVAFIIPCHLIVPKEAIDKILSIRSSAQGTIFKGTDLYFLNSIDVGEYEYGKEMKRHFIWEQLYKNPQAQ